MTLRLVGYFTNLGKMTRLSHSRHNSRLVCPDTFICGGVMRLLLYWVCSTTKWMCSLSAHHTCIKGNSIPQSLPDFYTTSMCIGYVVLASTLQMHYYNVHAQLCLVNIVLWKSAHPLPLAQFPVDIYSNEHPPWSVWLIERTCGVWEAQPQALCISKIRNTSLKVITRLLCIDKHS